MVIVDEEEPVIPFSREFRAGLARQVFTRPFCVPFGIAVAIPASFLGRFVLLRAARFRDTRANFDARAQWRVDVWRSLRQVTGRN